MLGQIDIKKANSQSEEDEGLIGLLALAVNAGWGAEVASSGTVVLRREDERGQPPRIEMSVYALEEEPWM